MKEELLLARQPIFDTQLNIFAYELLFRSAAGDNADHMDADQATSMVMLNTFSEVGIENVVGHHKAFINYTHNLILSAPPFSPDDVVIEVLEDVLPDADILAALKELKQRGFTIALDDFIYQESFKPLVELADIIKVDVLAMSATELEQQVQQLRSFPVKLLAEKVETQAMFELCQTLGFDYFQGFFLSKPRNITGKITAPNKLIVMELLAELQKPDIATEDLMDIIGKDPSLGYKLLRIINSAAYRRPQEIESLHRAILLLGPMAIKHWASLLALSNLSDKPHALREQTMLRAKVCEFIGRNISPALADQCFTVGMFSTLDAYFDTDMETLLEMVSISDEIKQALLNHEGLAGHILAAVSAYEKGEWGNIPWSELKRHGLSVRDAQTAYIDALAWSNQNQLAMYDNEAVTASNDA